MLEINWKVKKPVYRNLLDVKGLSHISAQKICIILGISTSLLFSNLSNHKLDQLNLLLSYWNKKTDVFEFNSLSSLTMHHPSSKPDRSVSSSPVKWGATSKILHNPILGSLDRIKKENITTLIQINSYRGRRLKFGYPVNGQRTRTNSKTARKLNKLF